MEAKRNVIGREEQKGVTEYDSRYREKRFNVATSAQGMVHRRAQI